MAPKEIRMSGHRPSAAPYRDVLTLQEVADWLKVTPRQVLRMGVPCIDLGHRTKRFLEADVEAWLEHLRSA